MKKDKPTVYKLNVQYSRDIYSLSIPDNIQPGDIVEITVTGQETVVGLTRHAINDFANQIPFTTNIAHKDKGGVITTS